MSSNLLAAACCSPGAGKILKLDQKRMVHALGIAGHFCPVPGQRKWTETPAPSAMTKYGSAGWTSAGGVTAALLAEMGYVGDTTVFEGDYGFWRFFASEKWEPEKVVEKLGEKWFIINTRYRLYPCFGGIHGALDCFISIIDQNNLMPEDIENVEVFTHPLADMPLWRSGVLTTQVDAQLNIAYCFAVAANRVRLTHWQDWATMRDPKLLEFMKKVRCQSHPQFTNIGNKDVFTFAGLVEVTARGKTFRKERKHAKGTPFTPYAATDKELTNKFKDNASAILIQNKIDGAVQSLLKLETVNDIRELMKQVTL